MYILLLPGRRAVTTFGGTFEMNVNSPKYLTDEEYSVIINRIKENL